ncbi:unnamed protein product, partial [Vitis vinifera]
MVREISFFFFFFFISCQKTKNYGGIPSCMGLVFGEGSNIVIPGASKNVILESVLWNQGLLWLGLKLGQLH